MWTRRDSVQEGMKKMKLEELLGADLYAQVQAKLDEVNSKEPDKLKHVRYADLSEGEYVGKSKHDALQTKYDSQTKELTKANDLIEQLKKGTAGDEELQGKITAYEGQVADLQAELAETKLKAAVKVALLSANASDVDYVTYKLNESLKKKGETLELDENGNIKGWDARLEALKTAFPTMFESGDDDDGGDGGYKPLGNNGLPKGNNTKTVTKEQFMKMTYEERLKLKKDNEKLYRQLAGN